MFFQNYLDSRTKVMIVLIHFFFLTAFCCMGGLLNRVRGGYENFDPEEKLGHDVAKRLAFAVPTGILTAVLSRNWFLGLWMTGASFATEMIGWGTYMSIGRHDEEFSRTGGKFSVFFSLFFLSFLIFFPPQNFALHFFFTVVLFLFTPLSVVP